jgi:hypothetical protein
MKKTIISFNPARERLSQLKTALFHLGYSEDKFPMEVDVLIDGYIDGDGLPFIQGPNCGNISQHWFIFKED